MTDHERRCSALAAEFELARARGQRIGTPHNLTVERIDLPVLQRTPKPVEVALWTGTRDAVRT